MLVCPRRLAICRRYNPASASVGVSYMISAVDVLGLQPGQSVESSAPEGGLALFVFTPPTDVTTIRIELVSVTGDADLYVKDVPFRPDAAQDFIGVSGAGRCPCCRPAPLPRPPSLVFCH